jgi:uncharacterized protein YggU (UPF0235/DUF167 family)
MAFQKGNKLGVATKRGAAKGKNNEELKAFLESQTIDALLQIDVKSLSNTDRLKLISIGLNYILPKLASTEVKDVSENGFKPITITLNEN